MEIKYSFWKGVRKALLQCLIFGVPMLVSALPEEWMNLTLGGVIALVINYVKVKATLAGFIE